MKKIITITIIAIFTFMAYKNVYAYTSGNTANLSNVVNDNTGELYKNVEALSITQEDVKYLDNVDFSKFEKITSISIENCYDIDPNKIIPNKKVHLYISNSLLDFSKFDLSKFEDNISISYSYNTNNNYVTPNITNKVINSEYNIDKKYDDKINAIAKEIYKKSSNVTDIIENVTLYVINNIEYDYDGIYNSLPKAESIIEHKAGVCTHYAYFESQLLNKLGIFTIDMPGYIEVDNPSVSHAWVILYIDNEWYGIDPTWIDEKNKVFNEIPKDNPNYMVKLSDKDKPFYYQHFPSFTFYDKIPIKDRTSKISIINDIIKDEAPVNNNNDIVKVEDTSMNTSNIRNIMGLILIVGGLVTIIRVHILKKHKL